MTYFILLTLSLISKLDVRCFYDLKYFPQIVTAATGRSADDGASSPPVAVPQFPLLSDDVRRLMLTSQTKEGIEESAEVIRDGGRTLSSIFKSPKELIIFIEGE